MKAMTFAIWLAVAALLIAPPTVHAEPVTTFGFTLLPEGGAIAGAPGETIGWGYSLVNYSLTDWLVVGFPSADPFVNATPDASVFDFPSVAPGATVTVPFMPGSESAFGVGLFQITWSATAPIGTVETGSFTLSADFYDANPFDFESDDIAQFLRAADTQIAAYSATVVAAPTSVPEPATLMLSGIGLALTGIVRRRRARNEAA